MLPGALGAGHDCLCLVECGVEDQTDETTRPPPSGLMRTGIAQDMYQLYTSFAGIGCKRYSYREGAYRSYAEEGEEEVDDWGVYGAPNRQRVGVTGWVSIAFLRRKATSRIWGSCPLCGQPALPWTSKECCNLSNGSLLMVH